MRAMTTILALISLLLLSACSAQFAAIQQNPAAGFPFRHSDFDYKVAWRTSEASDAVEIEGILKNVRYPYISSIDLTVFLLGTDGKVRKRVTTLPFPQQSQQGDVVSFNAKLHSVSITPGDTFKFIIHYVAGEGGPDDASDWRSSFAVDALTGAVHHKDNITPDKW